MQKLIIIIIIKKRKKTLLLLVSNEILLQKTAGKAPTMHFSCRDSDSVLTSPSFLRAQTETRTMLCFFAKPFTAHLLSHDAQQAFITEEWWSFPNLGAMALQICRTLLRGYSPARFKVEVLVCNLGGRPCPYHGPA